MIEQKLLGKNAWKPWEKMKKEYSKLFIEEQEEYGDLPELIERLMKGYFTWYKKDPVKFAKKYVEYEGAIDLVKGIILTYKIDGLGRTKGNLTWLTDHKTHRALPSGELVYTDLQTSLYLPAFEENTGIKADGVLWDYIRVKMPTTPRFLKAGSLSRAKNIDTMWPVYRQAIRDNKLKLKDYGAMKKLLENADDKFYKRVYLPRSEKLIKNLREETKITAIEMREKEFSDRTRTIARHCDWCQYKSLCQAELRGKDWKFILKSEYRKRRSFGSGEKSTEEEASRT